MSNQQQPSRPRPSWFRVASLSRPLPSPLQPNSPSPPVTGINVASSLPSSARPAFPPPTSSLPSSPVVQTAPPKPVVSTSPVPSSPVTKSHPATSSLPTSPKSGSPALKNVSAPSAQPPSQFIPKFSSGAELETLEVQQTEESKSRIGRLQQQKNNPNSDLEDDDETIITLAGDNRGAAMGLFQSPRKLGKLATIRGNSSGGWGRRGKGGGGVIVNSNVQGINNSIIFNSSCNYFDPGVHLTL